SAAPARTGALAGSSESAGHGGARLRDPAARRWPRGARCRRRAGRRPAAGAAGRWRVAGAGRGWRSVLTPARKALLLWERLQPRSFDFARALPLPLQGKELEARG